MQPYREYRPKRAKKKVEENLSPKSLILPVGFVLHHFPPEHP